MNAPTSGPAPDHAAGVGPRLETAGRLCFNQALTLLAEGAAFEAENALCAACALLPGRVEPPRALGKLRAQGGRWAEALVALHEARRVAPGDEETRQAIAEVERRVRRERLLLAWAPVALVSLAAAFLGAALLLR